jgi:hypothetical protein
MFVKLGQPVDDNATLCRVATLTVAVLKRHEEIFVLSRDCPALETVGNAIKLKSFPRCPRDGADVSKSCPLDGVDVASGGGARVCQLLARLRR